MARKTLAEQIAELDQNRTDYDIESIELENGFESGSDVLTNSDDGQARGHYVKVSKSKLRQPSSAIRGKTYNGEIVSRDVLYSGNLNDDQLGSRSESEEEENEYDGQRSDDGDDDSVNEISHGESDSGASLRAISDESESEIKEEEDNVSAEAKRSRIKQILAHERKHIVTRLSDSTTSDALKGYAVLQQQKEFDSLIDLRLKIQKALTSSNLLPVERDIFENAGLTSDNSSAYLIEATGKCYDLLHSILTLRAQLYTKDRIISNVLESLPPKRSFSAYLEATKTYDAVLNKYRGSVLTKWLAKIQNSSGSNAMNAGRFKALNQSAEQQVVSHMYDMDRLLKRTKLNRRQIKPLGYEYSELQKEEGKKSEIKDDDYVDESSKTARSVNFEEMELIFDDEDFYRVLLNDLVDKKIQSADPTSGLQFALRGAASAKLKKNSDTKASKGRKLRYHVQEQIANFDSPRPWLKWNDSQVDEFFASLLGQKINMNERSSDEEESEDEAVIGVDQEIRMFG